MLIVLRILLNLKIPQDNPEAGVPVENFVDYRELTLTFGAGEYIVRYRREKTNRVEIVRVRHIKEGGF